MLPPPPPPPPCHSFPSLPLFLGGLVVKVSAGRVSALLLLLLVVVSKLSRNVTDAPRHAIMKSKWPCIFVEKKSLRSLIFNEKVTTYRVSTTAVCFVLVFFCQTPSKEDILICCLCDAVRPSFHSSPCRRRQSSSLLK